MGRTSFDRSPLVITVRLILLLIVLVPLGMELVHLGSLNLGDRTPVLPGPPGSRMEPRPTPHDLVLGEMPLFNGKVTSMAFYKAVPDSPPETREYNFRFQREKDHYIYWEVKFEFPPAEKVYEFQLDYIIYKAGEQYAVQKDVTKISPGANWHIVYFGWDYPPGQYYVEVLYDGTVIANGGFETYE